MIVHYREGLLQFEDKSQVCRLNVNTGGFVLRTPESYTAYGRTESTPHHAAQAAIASLVEHMPVHFENTGVDGVYAPASEISWADRDE